MFLKADIFFCDASKAHVLLYRCAKMLFNSNILNAYHRPNRLTINNRTTEKPTLLANRNIFASLNSLSCIYLNLNSAIIHLSCQANDWETFPTDVSYIKVKIFLGIKLSVMTSVCFWGRQSWNSDEGAHQTLTGNKDFHKEYD